MKTSVLCFDLSDNAAGRADLLARLLAPLGEVEVIGPRSGPTPWMPVAGGPVRYTGVPERRMPGFLMTMVELSRRADGDLVYASKTRLGAPASAISSECSGIGRSSSTSTTGRPASISAPDPRDPRPSGPTSATRKGLPWTWLAERLTGLASGITVASRFLQQRFGGVLVPHVRDHRRVEAGLGLARGSAASASASRTSAWSCSWALRAATRAWTISAQR